MPQLNLAEQAQQLRFLASEFEVLHAPAPASSSASPALPRAPQLPPPARRPRLQPAAALADHLCRRHHRHPMGATTSSDTPTVHDIARALADQIRPGAAPRDVTVTFGVRRLAAAQYDHRSRGGPVTVYAQALHAALYGLPTDDEPLPAALDTLLQATHTATAPEQQTAVLRQVAEQLRNAAEILRRYQYRAQWDRFPDDVAEQLADAHDRAQQIAEALERVAPAFSNRPTTDTPPGLRAAHGRSASAPAASPASPAARRR